MRYILLHKTNAHYERGGGPSPELVREVGKLMGELHQSGALIDGDGLRPTSEGARVSGSTVQAGPFEGQGKVPAGFVVFRAPSLEDAAEQAKALAAETGAEEVDVRPATEAWDIGMAPRPERITSRRYLALYKGEATAPAGPLVETLARSGREPKAVRFRRGAPGKRLRKAAPGAKAAVLDGPFAETKELIGGFAIVEAGSLQQALDWALRYLEVVDTTEVDLLPLEDAP